MSAAEGRDRIDGVVDSLQLSPLRIEDLSTLRYIHSTAFRAHAGTTYTAEEIAAFEQFVRGARYAEGVLRDRITAAWLHGELVATGGWGISDDGSDVARLRHFFVQPFFNGLGIGRRLLAAAEQEAKAAGYCTFGVRCPLHAVGFFESAGYSVTSHGVRHLEPKVTIAVAFLRKCSASERAVAERAETRH